MLNNINFFADDFSKFPKSRSVFVFSEFISSICVFFREALPPVVGRFANSARMTMVKNVLVPGSWQKLRNLSPNHDKQGPIICFFLLTGYNLGQGCQTRFNSGATAGKFNLKSAGPM